MKTTLEMRDSLFRKAKAIAATRGLTLKQLVTSALERELGVQPPVRTSSILRSVRALANANAKQWKADLDAVSAVREQRR